MPMKACATCGRGFTPTSPRDTRCPRHQQSRAATERRSPSSTATRSAGYDVNRKIVTARDISRPCPICGHGRLGLDGQLTEVDHITPASHGGTNHVSNLRLTHRSCNRSRGQGGREITSTHGGTRLAGDLAAKKTTGSVGIRVR